MPKVSKNYFEHSVEAYRIKGITTDGRLFKTTVVWLNACRGGGSIEEGNSIVPRFALHSSLRQSGVGLWPAFTARLEAVPLSETFAPCVISRSWAIGCA